MADNFVGEIRAVGFNFAPVGWAFCNGQLLSISQNTALFSLLGTFYGGNGTSTFALPNLQGAAPLDQGTGLTGTSYAVGEAAGTESVTLVQSQLPAHNHAPVMAAAGNSRIDKKTPVGDVPAGHTSANVYAGAATPNGNMAPLPVSGQNLPHENRQPFLAVNFVIALTGIFPSRG